MARYDAIVIGGGPAGSTAALLLARAGRSVAVVEQAAFPRRKVCGEYVSAATLELLSDLGILDAVLPAAGPEVRRVAVYAGDRVARGDMPARRGEFEYGRAIRREHLDTVLLDAAARAGAVVWQPVRAVAFRAAGTGWQCDVASGRDRDTLHGACILAAHGTLDAAAMPSRVPRGPARADDLFGFTTRMRGAALPAGVLPLISFTGGYAGMVHTSHGEVTLSCCIRRDALHSARSRYGGRSAGDALLRCILAESAAARAALGDATCVARWLACGPLHPGARGLRPGGAYAVGNAAGEPHPIVGEGVSIAVQSAVALAHAMLHRRVADAAQAGEAYDAAWRRLFRTRIAVSGLYAQLALRPGLAAGAAALFHRMPWLLTLGARWSGCVDGAGLREGRWRPTLAVQRGATSSPTSTATR